MEAVAGQPFTATLIDPAGSVTDLGARIEVPVTRAIVSAWVAASLDGATWTVEIDAPLNAGDFNLVWRTGDPEPPEYETYIPLHVVAAGVVATPTFPEVDENAVRPDVDEIANLANSRTAGGGGGEISEFNEETDPTAEQVEGLIDQGVEAILAQLPTRFETHHYERVRHAITLYTLVLMEGSYFNAQLEDSNVDLWRTLLGNTMTGLQTRIEEERQQARILGRMEPRPNPEGGVLA